MKFKFYGVRGSISSPGLDTVRYGGNTSCVFLETDDGSLIVFDAGTGIRKLGDELLKRKSFKKKKKPDIYVLFSHYHWDHIQGFPFFKPAYQNQQKIHLVAAHLKEEDARSVLDQMVDPHFPVPGDQLHADVDVLSIDSDGKLQVGDACISTMPLNHPGGGSAYRVDTPQGSMAYVTDNELVPPTTPRTTLAQWQSFLSDVDFLIHDAMYLDAEREQHHGWGHSVVSQTLELARNANVSNVLLFHHSPERTDIELDHILNDSQRWIKQYAPNCEVFMAKEGDQYELAESGVIRFKGS